MSRFITVENLSAYMCQLKSLVLSLFCDHTSMKCIDTSPSFQYVSCPMRLLEELYITHPYHSLVIETFQTFHNKYDGCSCKTFLFFLTTYYESLEKIFDNNNQLFQNQIFNYLEQFINQSLVISQNKFSQKLSLNSDLFLRICRNQSIYSDCLYQAYIYFNSLKSDLSHNDLLTHFNNINHLTRVKGFEEKCLFIPGILLPINQSIIIGYKRTILIDGYILEDYVHLGYNNKLKLKQISSKSSWIYLIASILEEYSIDIILCTGKIDEKLKDLNQQRIFIENLSIKSLRLLDENVILNYITDINEKNILSLDYHQYNNDSDLIYIDKGSTILQYVPLEYLIDIKHEQFQHCLARFREILKREFYLNGSGDFENDLYKYWYENKDENLSLEYNLAYECFLQCLQLFISELTNRKDCFEKNLIDDFDSKFDAWKTSIELLKILMQIDNVVQIIDTDDLSDL